MLNRVLLSEFGNWFILVIAVILCGLGWGMRMVSVTLICVDSVGLKAVGLAYAILLTCGNIGTAIGSVLAGTTASFLPTPVIFKITALIIFIGVLPLSIIIKSHKN